MRITELRPMLWTEDFEGKIEYTQKLGFECVARLDEYPWASLRLDAAAIMLSAPNEHEPYDKLGFTVTFYLTTDDIESMWLKVKDNASVCYPIETFPWGMREFAIYDNNGYILQFGQEIVE